MTSALITVYHPGESVQKSVTSIAEQVDMVYICDNSPASNRQLFADIDFRNNIHYFGFLENLGLSCAFNRILKDPGMQWQDDDYIFFFDQDSYIEAHHIEQMISVYEDMQESGYDIGCLGPVYFNTSNGRVEVPKVKKKLSGNAYEVSSIITSSMLCVYRDLQFIGFWNEDVFLDMADWDICWRMKAAGKLCCMTDAAVLQHSVGSGEKKIGPLRLRVGQSFREYYQIRDGLYLFGRKYAPLKFRIRFIAMLVIRSPLHVMFLEHKKERMEYISKGFVDHFQKKRGALNSDEMTEKQPVYK